MTDTILLNDQCGKMKKEMTVKHAEVELVDDNELYSLDARQSLTNYLRSTWARRYFITAEARSKAFSSGRDTYLGKIWLILDPLFQVSVYVIVFGMILNVSRGIDNFVGFLVLGVIFFGFLSKGINGGSMIIQNSRNLIISFKFPRISIVLSSVIRQFIDNALPAIIAVLVAMVFQYDDLPGWSLIALAPLYLILHIFNLGITLIIGRITAFIPDMKSVISLLSRALFFVSGVFFSIDRFEMQPILKNIVEINPVYQFLGAVRTCVLEGSFPQISVWAYLSAWTAALLIIGLLFFWQAEERYTRVR